MQLSDRPKALLSWSSGKDSAYALFVLRHEAAVDVVALVTTIDRETRRVPVHWVREHLLELQAKALGLPLWKIEIPWPCSDADYRAAMRDVADRAVREGIAFLAFGDLFLQDIRAYREALLADTGLQPLFPLWGLATSELADRMVGAGVRATITCVDRTQLDPSFAGAEFDATFRQRLPPAVDPCGENGEFHTLVWDGPGFGHSVPIRVGDILEDNRFVHADVQPVIIREGE